GRGLRLLGLDLGAHALDALALFERRELGALVLGILFLLASLPVLVRLEPVDAAPAGLERDLAPASEPLLLDQGDDRRPRVAGRRVEDGEEAPRDEVEDASLVRREAVELVLDVGR